MISRNNRRRSFLNEEEEKWNAYDILGAYFHHSVLIEDVSDLDDIWDMEVTELAKLCKDTGITMSYNDYEQLTDNVAYGFYKEKNKWYAFKDFDEIIDFAKAHMNG